MGNIFHVYSFRITKKLILYVCLCFLFAAAYNGDTYIADL